MTQSYINAPDDHKIHTYTWQVDNPKAWVHINHGMSEHAARYGQFAQELNKQGYSVVAHNHRGHGKSPSTQLGYFSAKQGWEKTLADIDTVRDTVCKGGVAYYLMGHSMGSFIVQAYMVNTTRNVDAMILSGTNFQAPAIAKTARMIAKFERWRLGANKPSKLLQFLSFASFNQGFKPNRTDFDWLSKDQAQVDAYIEDPLCGFDCSTQLWIDLLSGLITLFTPASFTMIQKNLPIYIFGGELDPVGEKGKGLVKLLAAYNKAQQQNVRMKLYESGRHEMLNETNREEVVSDLCGWLKAL